MHRTFGGGGEAGFFGRVAKNRRLQRQTFSHRKEAEGIDTFRVSMLKYIEKNDQFRDGMEAVLGEGCCHVLQIRPIGGMTILI